MSQLTPKQKAVLDFLEKYQNQNGFAPSQKEIATHFEFQSLGTVQNYLVRLEREGFIQKSWNGKRSIQLSPTTPRDSSSPMLTPTDGSSSTSSIINLTDERQFKAEASLSRGIALEIPVLGKVAAGLPLKLPDDLSASTQLARTLISIPTQLAQKSGPHFALQVQGDSMIEDGIFADDYVIIRSQPTANNGDTVVASMDHEVTIKRFYKKAHQIELHPANSKLKPFIFDQQKLNEDPDYFKILGVMTGLIRSYL